MTSTAGTVRTDLARPSSVPTWLRWGALVLLMDIVVHNGAARFANPWEGWGVAAENAAFILITGLVLVGITYGVLARWALQAGARGRNRAASGALIAAVASVGSYVLFATWAPFVIAPAALLLGRVGMKRARRLGGRRTAIFGVALGGVSFLAFVALVAIAVTTGDYPFGL